MMCWRQVHLHSLQRQQRPVLGVSLPAALTGRFTARLCACLCVHVCRRSRDKLRETGGAGQPVYVQRLQEASQEAPCCIPTIS